MSAFIGVILETSASNIHVAIWKDTWQEAYDFCKKNFPNLPCICLDFMQPPVEVAYKLDEFFVKNGLSVKRRIGAMLSVTMSLRAMESRGSPINTSAFVKGLGEKR